MYKLIFDSDTSKLTKVLDWEKVMKVIWACWTTEIEFKFEKYG